MSKFRDVLRRKLAQPVTLDDMTALANEHAAKAARFRRLAEAMREHGAATVSDLPDERLGELFA